jgi:flagellar biosynthesis protein FlhG
VPCLSLAADDVMVIVSNSAESLTDAYATIKLLSTEYARREFRILVNRVDTITEAGLIFNRLKSVAKQYLGDAAQMKLIGYVPEDEKLQRAGRLGRTVLDAFPDAESSHAFRQLADVMLRWRKPSHSLDRTGFLYRLVESSRLLTEQLQH